MPNEELAKLKALAASMRKQLENTGATQGSLDELIGESYAKELASMTDAEAVQHLRSVDDLKLLEAYLVLSKRLNHPVLAEVCRTFMAGSNISDRILGAGEIGVWLGGTHDKKASRELALMVRNPEEIDEIRMAAYSSLELINNKATTLEFVRRNTRATNTPSDVLNEIDWKFVDSFL